MNPSSVLVINTGGTFGMVETERGLAPVGDLQSRIRQLIPEAQEFSFDLTELDPLIDSSDLTPSDWGLMAEVICREMSNYSGFVVIHGTDTLAYTAAALSFIFNGCDKPVLITGSQIPLSAKNSDAPSNFLDSIAAIETDSQLKGVYVCFGGRLLLGSRVRKVDAQAFTAFDTPNLSGYMEFDHPVAQKPTALPVFKDRAVATLLIYPGIPASLIDTLSEDPEVEAILLLSFGSGNLPSFSTDFTAGVKRATERGKLIVNLTQCLRGKVIQGAYATGSVLAEVGALPGYDLTPEAAFARMHYLLATSDNKKAVVVRWPQPLADELSRNQ